MRHLPQHDPEVRKSYFQIQTKNGSSKYFTRHAYELLGKSDTNVVLVHYLGNEKLSQKLPHGNSKSDEHSFVWVECRTVYPPLNAI